MALSMVTYGGTAALNCATSSCLQLASCFPARLAELSGLVVLPLSFFVGRAGKLTTATACQNGFLNAL